MAATFSFRRFPYRIGGGLVGFLGLAGLIVLIAGCRYYKLKRVSRGETNPEQDLDLRLFLDAG